MKLERLILKGFQQFRNLQLDFTDPKTGLPLDKICLIGRNGTGKSTILDLLYQCLRKPNHWAETRDYPTQDHGVVALKVILSGRPFWVCGIPPSNILRLLVDEPENSLYPDFLYDLLDKYLGIIRNTQFFAATHNPIIAAQFRPEERVVLDFDQDGYVASRRGTVPEGDDPNDLLAKDFEVRSLYGREGLAKWERFLQRRRLIKKAGNGDEKRALIDEYMNIGNAYNFTPDAIS